MYSFLFLVKLCIGNIYILDNEIIVVLVIFFIVE